MADELNDKDLKNSLNAWRESVDRQAERPDWFWARQRAMVSSQIQEPKVRRMPVLAWAGIAATVAVGAALMIPATKNTDAAPKSTPQVLVQASNQISDHELMQGLEETMNSGVPDALQPASTLQQEMENAYSAKSTSTGKESRQ